MSAVPVHDAAREPADGDDHTFDAFRVAAAVDRIIWNEEHTFPAADAAYLRRVVPRHRQPRFGVVGRWTSTGGATEGYAAGHGNVAMDGAEKHKSFTLNGERVTRVGQYKLIHDDRALEIRQVMDDEWDDDHRCARLTFTAEGRPKALQVLDPRDIALPLPFLRIVVRKVEWREWKTPV